MTNPHSSDQLFITKLKEIVLKNISREDFDVEELAREAHMSRSSIHRRLKRLINQNASQFIRGIRLDKSLEMLQQGLGTASEIAYKVGFGSPAYFTKCFHDHYGYPPGEVKLRVPDDGQIYREADINEKATINSGQPGNEKRGIRAGRKSRAKLIVTAVTAVAVTGLIFILVLSNSFSVASNKQSIVVLPFKNLSGDPENQYFADGIMEDVLNNLFHISDLRVISRTTSEHFRDTEMTSREIARQLNARNVLESSIRRDGDRVRISVQLIDARRDQHIWSHNYDRTITDIIDLQGDIAMQIADRLNTVISASEEKQLKKIPTESPEAYDNYLKARFLLHKADDVQRLDISRDGLMASLKYYEKAIEADPDFAEAYAGMANAWYNLSAWGWYKPYAEGISRAQEYFTKALELDPECAEAHALKGVWLAYPGGKFEESKAELRRALALNPNFPTAHQWYAQLLMITGPVEEAREHVDRAVELEPYFWVVQNLSAWIYYFEEEYHKGIEACIAARDLNPDFIDNNWLFVLHYVRLGEGEKAAMALHDLFKDHPSLSYLGDEVMDAYNKSGVDGIFNWLIDININRPLPVDGLTGNPFFIAWWYAILGNREESVKWFEKTIEAPAVPRHYFNLIATNPDFDILRGDPRFTAVIDKAGLAAYNTRPPR